jgi:hypothetical protein
LEKLCQVPSLEILDISRNKLTGIPDSIRRLSNLKVLSIAKNLIRKLPSCFGDMKDLRIIKFEGNPLVFPPQEILQRPPEMKYELWMNKLKEHLRRCGDNLMVDLIESDPVVISDELKRLSLDNLNHHDRRLLFAFGNICLLLWRMLPAETQSLRRNTSAVMCLLNSNRDKLKDDICRCVKSTRSLVCSTKDWAFPASKIWIDTSMIKFVILNLYASNLEISEVLSAHDKNFSVNKADYDKFQIAVESTKIVTDHLSNILRLISASEKISPLIIKKYQGILSEFRYIIEAAQNSNEGIDNFHANAHLFLSDVVKFTIKMKRFVNKNTARPFYDLIKSSKKSFTLLRDQSR